MCLSEGKLQSNRKVVKFVKCESATTVVINRNKICHFFNHLPNCTSDRIDNFLSLLVDDSNLNSASS